MWESPITMITENIVSDITRKTDEILVEYVHNVGFDVDKEELVKALAYDRDQYKKGYEDGRVARDAEIVRCKDCQYGHRLTDANGLNYRTCNYPWGHGMMVEEYGFCKWGERREK